jgi:diguanylate cyclase (GGDEF)-like protein/PAS domain S-box-containing protein
VIEGSYRMELDGQWFQRVTHMVNLLGTDVLDGVLVVGHTGEGVDAAAWDVSSSDCHGDYKTAAWLLELLDDRARIIEIDGMVEEIFGRPARELLGNSATQFVPPDNLGSAAQMWAALMARPGATAASRQRVVRPDGSTLWVDSFFVSQTNPDGTMRVLNFIHDVTEQRNQEAALEQLAQEFRSLAEEVPAAIFRCDAAGNVTFHNHLWGAVVPDDAPAHRVHDLIHPAGHPLLEAELDALASGEDELERSTRVELRGAAGDTMLALKLHAVGQPGSGQVSIVGSVEDITSTMTLRRHATHDPLTGLLNRHAIETHLTAVIDDDEATLAVAFIDLDGFKAVNDNFGHDVGDIVLATVAERLRRAFRTDDVVGRYGGDEFVVVCRIPEGVGDATVQSWAQRAMDEPIVWDGGEWQPSASVGTARPEPGDDVASILRRADQAMYLSKSRHRPRAVS